MDNELTNPRDELPTAEAIWRIDVTAICPYCGEHQFGIYDEVADSEAFPSMGKGGEMDLEYSCQDCGNLFIINQIT